MNSDKGNAARKVVTQVKNPELVAEKHDRILKAAIELFSRKGFHKTTIRDIAELSGINLSYLYKYISTKDDILYLFYQHILNEKDIAYEKVSNHDNPIRQLKEYIKVGLENVLKFNDEILTMFTESRHLEKESLLPILAKESELTKSLEKIIKQGSEQGVFKTKDTVMAANVIQYLMYILPTRGWNFRDQYTFTRFVELLTDFILAALGVDDVDR